MFLFSSLNGIKHPKSLGILLNKIKNKLLVRNIHLSCNRKSSNTYTDLQNICPGNEKYRLDPACKVALVSGGTSGIGLAAANQLLAAGARNITITGDNICQGKKAAGFLNRHHGMGKAMYVHCNINCMAQFEEAFKVTINKFKRIDIVVNAAGICDGTQWEREIVTNVVGTIRGTLLAIQYVGKEGLGSGGVVINIGGLSGIEGLPAAPTLCATQHAIVGLSKSFGHEVHTKNSGIRVACLCPGFTTTDFLRDGAHRAMTENLSKEFSDTIEKAKKQTPDPCGFAVVHLIKYAENGSVWICEGAKLYVMRMPYWESYSTLVSQYL